MNYENASIQAIDSLCEKYPRAYCIFGGAAAVNGDIDRLVDQFPGVIRNTQFYDWHESTADTLRRFCNLSFIDPALVEVYIGQTFDELAQTIGH